jgi:phage FluMu protein Com
MKEIRCPVCGRKLLEIEGKAKVSIKCAKCKNIILINTIKETSNNRLPN